MESIWTGTQLYVGKSERSLFSIDQIKEAIRKARETARIDGLMIWTDAEPGLSSTLCRVSRELGIETYLWFPVLADVPGCTLKQEDLVQNHEGTRGNGEIGAWDGLGTGDENFLFMCPNNKRIVDDVFQVYESTLASLDIDGVMLDRIRFPSAVNGFESIFTCFCDSCQEKFKTQYGFSMKSLKQPISDFLSRLSKYSLGELMELWNSLDHIWEISGLSELSKFRQHSVYDTVKRFSGLAQSRNLRVGLDLYSPSVSALVSQDYGLLSRTCDWIKPMMYCHAVAPAGLPLEIESLRKALRALCKRLDAGEINVFLKNVLGWDIPDSDQRLREQGLPEEIIRKELDVIAKKNLSPEARIYAGFEAVRHQQYKVDITESILERYLSHVHGRTQGIIASWNLLHIPDANLRLIGDLKR